MQPKSIAIQRSHSPPPSYDTLMRQERKAGVCCEVLDSKHVQSLDDTAVEHVLSHQLVTLPHASRYLLTFVVLLSLTHFP